MNKIKYESRFFCPKTLVPVSTHDKFYSHGVCHVCGHHERGTITHAITQVGYWNRPTLSGWLSGERKQWVERPLAGKE